MFFHGISWGFSDSRLSWNRSKYCCLGEHIDKKHGTWMNMRTKQVTTFWVNQICNLMCRLADDCQTIYRQPELLENSLASDCIWQACCVLSTPSTGRSRWSNGMQNPCSSMTHHQKRGPVSVSHYRRNDKHEDILSLDISWTLKATNWVLLCIGCVTEIKLDKENMAEPCAVHFATGYPKAFSLTDSNKRSKWRHHVFFLD
jgi:hypothetical protein